MMMMTGDDDGNDRQIDRHTDRFNPNRILQEKIIITFYKYKIKVMGLS